MSITVGDFRSCVCGAAAVSIKEGVPVWVSSEGNRACAEGRVVEGAGRGRGTVGSDGTGEDAGFGARGVGVSLAIPSSFLDAGIGCGAGPCKLSISVKSNPNVIPSNPSASHSESLLSKKTTNDCFFELPPVALEAGGEGAEISA